MTLRRSAGRAAGGLVTGSGAAATLRWRRRQRGDFRVFILEYHDVGGGPEEPEGVVSMQRLRRHIRYLKRDFRLVSLAEGLTRLTQRGALHEDLVVLTFDDGYAGNYEFAWPVLRDERVPAAIFLTTGFLDGAELWFDLARRCLDAARHVAGQLAPNLHSDLRMALGQWPLRDGTTCGMERLKRLAPETRNQLVERLRAVCPPLAAPARPLRWDQVREMVADGIEAGCHTVSHPILSTLPRARQEQEIRQARDRITEEIGTAPTLFAYPNGAAGDLDATTTRTVQEAGFIAACTTIRGSNRAPSDPFRLKRLGVGADPCYLLGARLAGLFDEGMRSLLRGRAIESRELDRSPN